VPERYVYLTGDKTLVRGSKFGLVIDFATGGLHRLNEPACGILECSRQAISLEKAVEILDLSVESAAAFLQEMQDKELITITTEPQEVSPADEAAPPAKLDFVWLEVISQCNLRCLHCYAEAPPQTAAEPSTGVLLDWMDQAAALGCQKIQLTGGECTLRADLQELLTHARPKFETIEIFTNATLLDEPLIRFLAENQIQVAFSFYSYNPETHDRIAGVPGSHRKTLNSLKLLLAYDVKVRGGIIGLKQNEQDLEATEFFLSELGVPAGPADPVRPCGRGRQQDFWPVNYGQCMVRSKPAFLPMRQEYCSNQHWNSCWFGKAAITSQGDVLPCVFSREQVAGNLHGHSLASILQDGMLPYWQLTRDKVSICRDCEYRYICRDCRPWAYGYTGNLYAKSPTCTYDPYTGEWGPADSALKP
jgi:radical SAM protein with 4Fe4S-binding SPASM domain